MNHSSHFMPIEEHDLKVETWNVEILGGLLCEINAT